MPADILGVKTVSNKNPRKKDYSYRGKEQQKLVQGPGDKYLHA
jgi:hypothetical protein